MLDDLTITMVYMYHDDVSFSDAYARVMERTSPNSFLAEYSVCSRCAVRVLETVFFSLPGYSSNASLK